MLDEMDFLQSYTRDNLMLSGADMCNLGSISGLGNFGGIQLSTTVSTEKLLQGRGCQSHGGVQASK